MAAPTHFFTENNWESILHDLVFFCQQCCSKCHNLDTEKPPQFFHLSSPFVVWRPAGLHDTLWKVEGKFPGRLLLGLSFLDWGSPGSSFRKYLSGHTACSKMNTILQHDSGCGDLTDWWRRRWDTETVSTAETNLKLSSSCRRHLSEFTLIAAL